MKIFKKILFALIIFCISIVFHSPSKAEAATNQNLVILSALSYSVLDSQRAPMNLSSYKFTTDSKLVDIRNKFSDAKNRGLIKDSTVTSLLSRTNAFDWQVYNYSYNKYTGFFGVIYKSLKTGEYVVAFRGSNNSVDWLYANLSNAVIGFSQQTNEAVALIKKIPNYNKRTDITLTGHSLGGYLATSASLLTGIKCVTFNAPGFNKNSYYAAQLQYGNLKKTNKNYSLQNFYIYDDFTHYFGYHLGTQTRQELKDGKIYWGHPYWDTKSNPVVSFFPYF